MKYACLFLILILNLLTSSRVLAQAPPGNSKPLTQAQLLQLVEAGVDNERLAKAVAERGIDFELAGDVVSALRQKGALPVLLKGLGESGLKAGRIPIDKDLLRELVTAGTDGLLLVKAVLERGIDFHPAAEFLQALREAGATESLIEALRDAAPRPLAADQLLKLLAAEVAQERVTRFVSQRGLAFRPTEEYLEALRIAGAGEAVLQAVRLAKRPPAFLLARTLEGHERVVNSLAFSPDGRTLASASMDRSVRLWDVREGRELRQLRGHTGGLRAVAFSPDGRFLASGGDDSTIRVWDAVAGEERRQLAVPRGRVDSVAFSPDGKHLVAGGDEGTVWWWDFASGDLVRTVPFNNVAVYALAFSPDGELLAAGFSDGVTRIWETRDGTEHLTLPGHGPAVNDLAFRVDGKMLATAGGEKTVWLYEVSSGRGVRALAGHSARVWCAELTRDGSYLVSGSADGTVRLWSVQSGTELAQLKEDLSTVPSVAFSADGRYAAAGADGPVLLWRLEE